MIYFTPVENFWRCLPCTYSEEEANVTEGINSFFFLSPRTFNPVGKIRYKAQNNKCKGKETNKQKKNGIISPHRTEAVSTHCCDLTPCFISLPWSATSFFTFLGGSSQQGQVLYLYKGTMCAHLCVCLWVKCVTHVPGSYRVLHA